MKMGFEGCGSTFESWKSLNPFESSEWLLIFIGRVRQVMRIFLVVEIFNIQFFHNDG